MRIVYYDLVELLLVKKEQRIMVFMHLWVIDAFSGLGKRFSFYAIEWQSLNPTGILRIFSTVGVCVCAYVGCVDRINEHNGKALKYENTN